MRVLLGDPNVVCGTNTKGEVCLSGGACTALSGPLGGHLALTAQEHEALSMLRMACSMHLSQRALLRMSRRCPLSKPIFDLHCHFDRGWEGDASNGGLGLSVGCAKTPNGIVEQRGVESTSRWGAFLRSVTPDRRPGDYQHAACRILNGIAKRIETTLQALPVGTPGKAQALATL